MNKMKVAIHGTGNMGKIVKEVLKEDAVAFVNDVKEIDVPVDVVIDFSHYSKLDSLIEESVKRGYPLVIATTGYTGETLAKMVEASKKIPILLSSNTSLGVSVMRGILRYVVPKLQGFDIEVIEKHHNKKIDAPSGTALTLVKEIKEALKDEYKIIYGRSGVAKREEKEIGVHAVRGGTIVGEHTVIFAGEDEIIEITHKALSKKIFAVGAVKCAEFIKDKKNGFYTMDDIFKEEI